jgi:hypothetical protein
VAPGDLAGRATRRKISYRLRSRNNVLAGAPRDGEERSSRSSRWARAR